MCVDVSWGWAVWKRLAQEGDTVRYVKVHGLGGAKRVQRLLDSPGQLQGSNAQWGRQQVLCELRRVEISVYVL